MLANERETVLADPRRFPVLWL